jgi:hypothetical protein
MCKKSMETIDHILLHWEVSRDVGIDLPSFRDKVGHAPTGGGAAGL